jgi:hypothetical protein
MNALDNKAMQALSDAGAQCGVCGDQPGDRICPECEHCYRQYVAALRTAGWGPRAEMLREAAEAAHAEGDRLYDDVGLKAAEAAWGVATKLRAMADEAAPKAVAA